MLDRMPSHMAPSGARVSGDALAMPFAAASFDLVTCNLFLHHFHGATAQRLLDEMTRIARRAVVINDLERGWVPWLVMKMLSPGFSRLVRYDGPVSVRQAYTAPELARLAGARPHTVVRLFPYRLGLILWCGHAA
jgi:ubiquinone/menaquinone biosynthesis C-methylase UbiE